MPGARWAALLLLLVAVAACGRSGAGAGGTGAAARCPVQPPGDLVAPGTLTFGTNLTGPPLDYSQGNQPAGSEIDLARAIAGQMCLGATFIDEDFAALFPSLNAKKFDAVISRVGMTAERERSFDFVPYFQGGVQLMVKKGSGLYFEDEGQLCGHSVATDAGSVEAQDLKVNAATCPADRPMSISTYSSNAEAIEQLRKGSAQVTFLGWPLVAHYVRQSPELFAVGSPILTGEAPGQPRHRQGIVIRKGDGQMLGAISSAFANLENDGAYAKILQRWGVSAGDIRDWKGQ